ncbi:MAG: hypothetical protein KDD34_09220 [Bdellovibrionales bacterium]|nr:hypothetical protein [Bdellovibrionales bacterium]
MKLVPTADKSPSLEITYSGEVSELMHHSHGAFPESVYIYGETLALAIQHNIQPHILSIGLGLAYNEILSFCISEKMNIDISMTTFESEPFLRDSFFQWTQGHSENSPLYSSYDTILKMATDYYQVSISSVREQLKSAFGSKQLVMKNEFQFEAIKNEKFSVIFYDPFSNKASPDFWTESFLSSFLSHHADLSCIFSTYAATGILKRTLKANKFEVELRNGFGGKRHSTRAIRSSIS